MRKRIDDTSKAKSIKSLNKIKKIVGSKRQIAIYCGIKSSSIDDWFINGVPAHQVLMLESLVQGKVTKYEIRPDIYKKDK